MDEIANMTMRDRLTIVTATNYGSKFISVALSFLITPVILRAIGPASYGLWIMINSIAGYGALLDCGMANAIIKYVAEYRVRGDFAGLQSLVSTVLTLYSFLGLLGVAASAIAAFLLRGWYPAEGVNASLIVFLIGTNVALALPGTVPSAVLRGLQRFDLLNAITTGTAIVSTAATMVMIRAGAGLAGILMLNLAMLILGQVIATAAVRRVIPELTLTLTTPSREKLKVIFSFSLSVFVVQVAGRLQTKTDEIVIGTLAGLTVTAPYAIARRLSVVPEMAVDQFLKIVLPVASEIHATTDIEKLRRLFVMSSRLTIAVIMPVGLSLAWLSPVILTRWVGPEYASASPIVVILVAASIFNTSMWPAAAILQGMSRHRILAAGALANGLVNLILSILLLRRYGLLGVAMATLIPTVAECLFFVWPYAMRVLRISWIRLVREILLPVATPLALSIVPLIVLTRVFNSASVPAICATVGLGCVLYGSLFLLRPEINVERDLLRKFFEQLTPRTREVNSAP